jgi:hypothetical protein
MTPLAIRAKLLELEAELQRVSLQTKLDGARQKTNLAWALPVLGTVASWLARSRSRWFGVGLVASRMLWRSQKSAKAKRNDSRSLSSPARIQT